MTSHSLLANGWLNRPALSWALYDWGNSVFSLSVVTVFVPLLLAGFWNDGAESTVTTFRLGLANGAASFIVAIFAPFIGAFADRAGRRKAILIMLASLGVVMTAGLTFVAQGQWPLAVACYVLASIGFAGSNSLYDAMLVDVAAPIYFHKVSAWGYALGYLGGSILFAFNIWMVASPATFGLSDDVSAMRIAFLLVAIWWVLFSIPLLLFVHESPAPDGPAESSTLSVLMQTIRSIVGYREVLFFLIAYWLYIDGVYTIIKMAVDFGLSQGLSTQDLVQAILVTNLVGFPSAILFGQLGHRFGAKAGLVLALLVYIVVTFAAVFVTRAIEFYALAAAIGFVQGGVQSLSRSFYAGLIPAGKSAAFFGFFNLIGKFSAVLGPILAGSVALAFGSQRLGILSILILFIAGLLMLARVPAAKSAV